VSGVVTQPLDALLEGLVVLPGLLAGRPAGGLPPAEVVRNVLAQVFAQEPRFSGGKAAALDLWKGGLFYALDDLDAAHRFFQEDGSPEGSYWHGMLHRREGDFGNALYWIRRAGRIKVAGWEPGFDPAAFVGACEKAARAGTDPEHLLKSQRREWEAMMQHVWTKIAGAPPLEENKVFKGGL
jgi:hypothetical protein